MTNATRLNFHPGDRVVIAVLPKMPGRHRVNLGDEGIIIGQPENEPNRITIKLPARYVLVPLDCLALLPEESGPVECLSEESLTEIRQQWDDRIDAMFPPDWGDEPIARTDQ